MPKTNTKAKQTGWKRQFDLTNRKVQFFVVIGIFAILGGGYFTVRSFAAEATYIANVQNGKLNPSPKSPCGTKTVNDPAKGSTPIMQAYCLGPGLVTVFSNAIPSSLPAGTYQTCAAVRSGNGVPIKFAIKNDVVPLGTGQTISRNYGGRYDFVAGADYSRVCTPGATSASNSNLVGAKIEFREPGSIMINYIVTEKVTSSAAPSKAPAAAPAPTK